MAIRPMEGDDIAAGLRLCAQAGWNQTRGDWERLLAWEPEGCFVAERGGQIVGTVTTTVYGIGLAWIGMLLVDAAFRRQGVGRWLLERALAWVEDARRVSTTALDATPLGKTLYDGMGFTDQHSLRRWEGVVPPLDAPAGVRPLGASDLDGLSALEAAAFGADRGRVLRGLIDASPGRCFVLERDGLCRGYVCCRPGARTWYVGPWVASDAPAAAALLRAALAPLVGQAVAVDVPDSNEDAARLVARIGLRPLRPFLRMARGGLLPPADLRRCYAIAGPEVG